MNPIDEPDLDLPGRISKLH